MFFAAKPPPETACTELRALRLSLNAPVVAVDELPVGPARAGIALCAGPACEPHVTVAVRSLRSVRLALYAPSGELGEPADRMLALEAALSFAEGMGFLFDDDEVEARGDAGPVEAARLWRELLGAEAPAGDDVAQVEPPHAPEAEALLLEKVVDPEPESPPPPPLPLTKFRGSAAGGPPVAGPGMGGPALGRGPQTLETAEPAPGRRQQSRF